MKALHARLVHSDDRGFSLVEVMIAMFLFTIISMGLIFTMVSVLSVSRDSRARQVALNLAAEEIDRARSVEDVTELVPWSTEGSPALADPNDSTRPAGPVALNQDVFHIEREVVWVTNPDSVLRCGASATGDKLRYKRVNVRVWWDNMRGSEPVASDTIINPRERVNDPTKGSILISVLNASGTGAASVGITTNPTLADSPDPTDAEGCSYLLKVAPGTYTVNLAKTGYVDDKNVAAPSATNVVVVAGATTSLNFQYDEAATFNVTYPATTGPLVGVRPNTLETSVINTYRTQVIATGTSHKLHPVPSGYTLVAGDVTKCPASNPANWVDAPPLLAVDPPDSYAAEPGGTVSVPVKMGTVLIAGAGGGTIIAVSAANTAAHPTCTTSTTYTFAGNSTSRTLALPWGTWNIYKGSVSTGNLIVKVTLDPRVPVVIP